MFRSSVPGFFRDNQVMIELCDTNPRVPGSKPQGGSMFDLTVHPSEVNQWAPEYSENG